MEKKKKKKTRTRKVKLDVNVQNVNGITKQAFAAKYRGEPFGLDFKR